ncbi:MAG: hypothetical protein FPO08_15880 [Geobacter sp.]|nr:MAG: hypothetical protein FPO08_15880 [Geobacter sp.]
MVELKFNESGTDAVYLANVNILFAIVFSLAIFNNDWREDKLGSKSFLQKCIDWFRQMYEGGRTGNRLHVAARKTARNELNQHIRKILYYVGIFGDEGDVTALINSGVVAIRKRTRNRKPPKAANRNQQ